MVLGVVIGVSARKRGSILWRGLRGTTFLFASIPVLVLLFWCHYPLQALLGVVIDPFYTTVFTLAAVNSLYVGDLVARTMSRFPSEYLDAATVCGISNRKSLLKIQLPLIVRYLAGPVLAIQVVMLHMTLFGSLISVEDLFRQAQRLNAQLYRPVEIYTAMAVLYLILSAPLNAAAELFEARYGRDISKR